jgi:phospholipid/cholesterol/gamma-HCH transport system substrate-binding protein
METRANFVLIGTFTLAVIAAAFGFVLWFQNLHSTKARTPLRIVFEGAASGLRNGGNVNFNGIRVGEVISVKLDNPKRVVALAMVENVAPIRKDTQVGLEFQGLTGVAAIALKGGDEAAPPVPLDTDGVPILTADPELLRDISESIRATLNNVNRLVADNQETMKNAMKNVEVFTATLAKNSEVIDAIMLKIDSVMGKADGVMGKANTVVARTDNILLGLDALAGGKDGGELTAAVKSFHELTENLDKRSGALMLDGRRTLGDISRAVNNLDRNPTRLLFGAGSGSTSAPAAAAPPPAAPPVDPVPERRRRR